MKVCKKCKKHVANKIRICKYCGADVSKARIIKNNKKNSKNPIKQQKDNRDIKVKSLKKETIAIEPANIKKDSKQTKQKKRFNIKKTIKLNSLKQKILKIKNSCTKINYKTALIIISILMLGSGSGFIIYSYSDYNNLENNIAAGEKATTNKIFAMGDLITYKNVDYKVIKVETSEGNNYKSPKEGNQFLIITVSIKNNSSNKIKYSYKNWTMSNSKGDEEKRIFTSINVNDALYSGDLVIGGIKTGSMVFEQPKKDPKLKINFYELKSDENGEEIIDENKKIFSVSIKVPEKETPTTIEKSDSDNQKDKLIKTSTKKQA